MADIRQLMAKERQGRQINHELASYSKAGALMCVACQLNIRSEALWDGHLKSANHKSNIQKRQQISRISNNKRKFEDVEEEETSEDFDSRKKLKPKGTQPKPIPIPAAEPEEDGQSLILNEEGHDQNAAEVNEVVGAGSEVLQPTSRSTAFVNVEHTLATQTQLAEVDEDEWAAFERDVAPLAQPDYTAATITAPAVSAAQLEKEAETDRRRLRDAEAEDEKDEESRRLEEEFEVMEEMEARITKLKEKREALRQVGPSKVDTGQDHDQLDKNDEANGDVEDVGLSDTDDDDVDEWYS